MKEDQLIFTHDFKEDVKIKKYKNKGVRKIRTALNIALAIYCLSVLKDLMTGEGPLPLLEASFVIAIIFGIFCLKDKEKIERVPVSMQIYKDSVVITKQKFPHTLEKRWTQEVYIIERTGIHFKYLPKSESLEISGEMEHYSYKYDENGEPIVEGIKKHPAKYARIELVTSFLAYEKERKELYKATYISVTTPIFG